MFKRATGIQDARKQYADQADRPPRERRAPADEDTGFLGRSQMSTRQQPAE